MTKYEYSSVDLNDMLSFCRKYIKDIIWKNSLIEVKGLTFPQTECILENYELNGIKFNDAVVVNNIKRSWQYLFNNISQEISLDIVKEYNYMLQSGSLNEKDAGYLRNNPVYISGTDFIPPNVNKEILEHEIKELKENYPNKPFEKAVRLFALITKEQWFSDGNKRTATMVANHILVKSGIGIFAIKPKLMHQFIDLLIKWYESDGFNFESNEFINLQDFIYMNCIRFSPDGFYKSDLDRII